MKWDSRRNGTVDKMGVDKMGIEEMGVEDEVGINRDVNCGYVFFLHVNHDHMWYAYGYY